MLGSSVHGAECHVGGAVVQVTFPQKAKVVTQGEPGDAFFVVETGILAVVKDGKPVMRLSPGQVRHLTSCVLHLCCCRQRSRSVCATMHCSMVGLARTGL